MLKQLNVEQPVDDFAKAAPVQSIGPIAKLDSRSCEMDQDAGDRPRPFIKTIRKFKRSRASLSFTVLSQYFVNTEGTVTRQGSDALLRSY